MSAIRSSVSGAPPTLFIWRAKAAEGLPPASPPVGPSAGKVAGMSSIAWRLHASADGSEDFQLGLQRAAGLDGLQDGDHVARSDPERVQAFDQFLKGDAAVDDAQAAAA